MGTSPYVWKILEWDNKPQTNKQTYEELQIVPSLGIHGYWAVGVP